uniref:Uncharacterized protein n=1 Tax=uncultured marine bacterium Ant29B7 TaxID=360426 RepID=Q2PY84_9BACT|nr:hypothetical protein [uncultured marine bacterium Ant29B7]
MAISKMMAVNTAIHCRPFPADLFMVNDLNGCFVGRNQAQ